MLWLVDALWCGDQPTNHIKQACPVVSIRSICPAAGVLLWPSYNLELLLVTSVVGSWTAKNLKI